MDKLPDVPEPSPAPFQFSLRGLIVFTAICAFFCCVGTLGGVGGIVAVIALIGGLGLVAGTFSDQPKKSLTCSGVLVFIMLMIFLLLPSLNTIHTPSSRSSCGARLNQIALAMLWYEHEHGCLPPAYIADKDGKPMHSWRVLLLPYLEQKTLYKKYNFDEPWDGPNNSKLASTLMSVYCCPKDEQNPGTMTSYAVVVGPHCAFTGPRGTKTKSFTDGLGNTILIAEVANSGIHWMEPRDLDYWQMPLAINASSSLSISSEHSGVAGVITADRSVLYLKNEIAPRDLKALLTRDGGETVDLGALW